eukprot:SM000171S03215  [mRNA]  locus=s171:51825:54758:+ [translate_table: standard]
MKFCKLLRSQADYSMPEWRNKFLSYKDLKKRLKSLSSPDCFAKRDQHPKSFLRDGGGKLRKAAAPAPEHCASASPEVDEFINLLNVELEKFNNFYLEKEEDFVIRLQDLKEHVEHVRSKCSQKDMSACEDCAKEIDEVRRAIVAFHGEMVLLKNYSLLNYIGLVKILKKHDKIRGSLLRSPYITNVLRQPFYTTELLSRLVNECEQRLLVVFPAPGAAQSPSSDAIGDRRSAGVTLKTVASHLRGSANLAAALPEHELIDSIYRSAMVALDALDDIQHKSRTPQIPIPGKRDRDSKSEEAGSSDVDDSDAEVGPFNSAVEGGSPQLLKRQRTSEDAGVGETGLDVKDELEKVVSGEYAEKEKSIEKDEPATGSRDTEATRL